MEEILASIRRIISEDGEPVGEAAGGVEDSPPFEDDILEPVAEDMSVAEAEVPTDDEHLLSVEELLGKDLDLNTPEPAPLEPVEVPEISDDTVFEAPEAPVEQETPIVDFEDVAPAEPMEEDVTTIAAPEVAPAAPKSSLDTGAANALESFVRSMIEPMIHEWLENNLESLVNAKVDAELQRVATRVRQALIDEK
ncbi:MAG: DUF2497 domain-containing protein [Pseudomonadota bacterium]